MRPSGLALVARRPHGHYLQHPVTAETVCTVIARLAEVVPHDATWEVTDG